MGLSSQNHLTDDAMSALGETSDPETAKFVEQWLSAIDRSVETNLANILRRLPNVNKESRKGRRGFERRLFTRWRLGFDYFDCVLDLAMQFGAQRVALKHKAASPTVDPVFEVLVTNHGRACLVAGEVRALLTAGFASGAHGRWRTLHELAVISFFIKENGPDVAQRFIDHWVIERSRAADEYQHHGSALNQEPFSDEEIQTFRKQAQEMKLRYGQAFMKPYGWASQVLARDRVGFGDVEKASGVGHLHPYYRMASSDSVHASYKSTIHNMGMITHNQPSVLTGASNYGLADPAHGALISLHQCTTALLPEFAPDHMEGWGELWVTLRVMQELTDQAGEAFLRIQKQIEVEDAANLSDQ